MSSQRIEPITTAEYSAAIRVAAGLSFGEELIGLFRALDQYVNLSEAMRDGGRTARVNVAYAALVRTLAASGEVDRGTAPQ